MKRTLVLALVALVLAACDGSTTQAASSAASARGRPAEPGRPPHAGRPVEVVDEEPAPLRMNHVQSRGTHNSTHRDPKGVVTDRPEIGWGYSHRTLTAQLEEQGVRQIELDVHWNPSAGRFDVYHVWLADDRATCDELRACLGEVDRWLADHPSSGPVMVMIEPKDADLEDGDPFTQPLDDEAYDRLDEVLRASVQRVVTPDSVTTAGKTLRSSIVEDGWPLLDAVRGSVVYVLDGDDHAARYSDGWTSLAGRAMFVQAPDPASPVAAFVSRSGEGDKYERMRTLVAQGFMVRDLTEDFEAAKAAGAHFISTDFPESLELSGDPGAPSRCNPVSSAGVPCTDRAVESHDPHGYPVPAEPSDEYDQVVVDKVDRIVIGSVESATGLVQRRSP